MFGGLFLQELILTINEFLGWTQSSVLFATTSGGWKGKWEVVGIFRSLRVVLSGLGNLSLIRRSRSFFLNLSSPLNKHQRHPTEPLRLGPLTSISERNQIYRAWTICWRFWNYEHDVDERFLFWDTILIHFRLVLRMYLLMAYWGIVHF